MDSTDSGDGIVAGTSNSTSPITELPTTSRPTTATTTTTTTAPVSPTTEPSAPPIELASPTHSVDSTSTKVITPNDTIDLPPTYDDVMSGAHLRTTTKQLPSAPQNHSNSTPDITSDLRRDVRDGGHQSGSLNERVSEEDDIDNEADGENSNDPGRRRKKNKCKRTAASKIKKGLENIAFFLIQILD